MRKGDLVACRCCLNCHFLFWQESRTPPVKRSVSRQERLELLDNGFPKQASFTDSEGIVCSYVCKKLVWTYKEINPSCDWIRDRGDSCFFYQFTEGMLPDATMELERRAADRREAEKDRSLTRKAFWVAFAALLFSILVAAVNLAWDIWKHFHSKTSSSPQSRTINP